VVSRLDRAGSSRTPSALSPANCTPRAIHQAIIGGFVADRVAWAFASGYQAALRALVPDLPADRICALCVTEEGGNSPRAIKSTLKRSGAGYVLDGAKRWTTLGPDGGLFLVAARDANAAGERPSLKVARVASNLPGVSVEKMPPTRFVPEVPHARLKFENVLLPDASLLPGDGYDEYDYINYKLLDSSVRPCPTLFDEVVAEVEARCAAIADADF
jgi:acyl-CoA dehydrogenase